MSKPASVCIRTRVYRHPPPHARAFSGINVLGKIAMPISENVFP